MTTIEITVEPATAEALRNTHRRAAIGRLIDRIVQPGSSRHFAAVMDEIASRAAVAGLIEAELATELQAHKAERRR